MTNKRTANGLIMGLTTSDGEVVIYKGIPYALPPLGALRWKAPLPLKNWEGVKSCTTFTANAVQAQDIQDQPWMAPYSKEFFEDSRLGYSEDCLHLNVWTKAHAPEKRPVFVYIHGGGFGGGAGSIPIYDGESLARKGIVFVSINYRLGVFGFLAHDKLSKESETGTSGNYGILDQIMALKWVQKNIREFGGDPDNVTISGQSAGGASVQILATSPYAKGLFRNIFSMSFSYFNGHFMKTRSDLEAESQKVFSDMTLDEMRGLSENKLLSLNLDAKPCMDGEIIPHYLSESFANGTHHAANMIMGILTGDAPLFQVLSIGNGYNPMAGLDKKTYEDAVLHTFGGLSKDCLEAYPASGDAMVAYKALNEDSMVMNLYYLAKRITAKKETPIFIYSYNHTLPGVDERDFGAFHTADVPYWLGNLDKLSPERIKRLVEADYRLSKKLMNHLVQFAWTGNPNGEGLAQWSPYDQNVFQYFYIGDDEFATKGFDHKKLKFWKQYFEAVLY